MKKLSLQLLPLMLILCFAIVAGFPFLQGKLLSSHDSQFYPARATVFYSGLAEGTLLPRWTQEFAAGYGEPYFNFNAPILYYLSSVFRFCGVGSIRAINLSCFVFLLAAGLGMYVLAKEFFGISGGLVAATAYLFAPYTLLSLYVRGSYSEFSGTPFIPLSFYFFYKAATSAKIRYFIFAALSYAALLLSNNTVSVMVTPFLGLWVLAIFLLEKRLLPALRGVICLVTGLLLAAFFWLPSVVEKSYIQTDKLLQGSFFYQNHFVFLSQFFTSDWGYGVSTPGTGDGMSFQIGYVHLALSLLSLIGLVIYFKRDARKENIVIVFFGGTILLAIFLCSTYSLFIWQAVRLLQYFQFPWRYLTLIALGAAFLSGAALRVFQKSTLYLTIATGVFLTVLIFGNLSHTRPKGVVEASDDTFSQHNIIYKRLEVSILNEFRPRWVKLDPPAPSSNPLVVVDTPARLDVVRSRTTEHLYHIEGERESLLRFNIHYFPGWQVLIDGRQIETNYDNPYGLMEFTVPAGSHEIRARYTNTPVRNVGNSLSLLALALLLSAAVFAKKLRKTGLFQVSQQGAAEHEKLPLAD